MSAVSETIVREYFELREFLIRQHRKYVGQARGEGEEDDIDFFVFNPHPSPSPEPLPFVLTSADLSHLRQAIVVVKGWHTGIFSPGVLSHSPEIFRFVEPKVFRHAAKAFGVAGAPLKILIVPALPHSPEGREESIALLKSKGVDHVIPFRTMLCELINGTQPNRNYQKSDLLQIIRILKNYEFFKEPQLELFKAKRTRASTSGPPSQVASLDDEKSRPT